MNLSYINGLKLFFTGILLFIFSSLSFASWNLPYKRPSKYDYSSFYNNELNSYFNTESPDIQYKKFKSSWQYYKSKFMMPNGLIRHQRGISTGRNEAVSEGIGYGMLLAVLNNDQDAFDSIFNGANTFMWSGSSKSYWNWSIVVNDTNNYQSVRTVESGAATDADLDIGLALVFADKLVQKNLWKSGTTNPSYNTRALEVIGTIKTKMCSGNYLLPGDNWGGSGLSNLNPSYFATAWLKVFNDYQKTYDFTGVIDGCYSVLKGTTNYSKGQAPDWCTTSGGRGSKSYDMSNDAIRTPWRIAMDALWFDDTRAIEYCSNAKKTLSPYLSDFDATINQMAQYNSNGTTQLANTSGGFKECVMWSCSALGSKDAIFSSKILTNYLFTYIFHGNNSSTSGRALGNYQLSDQYYYYNESIGMLGYAALTGQFPNMQADVMDPPDPEYVKVTSPLKASVTSITLPGTVTFTATLSNEAAWTLTLTGKTSGKISTYSGNGTSVSVVWSGRGYFTVESLVAVLGVTNIDASTSASSLNATVQITAVPTKPVIAAGSSIIVHDMENKGTTNYLNGKWFIFNDIADATSPSTTYPGAGVTSGLVMPGYGNPNYGLKISFTKIVKYAGVGTYLTGSDTLADIDLSAFDSVSFDYKNDSALTSLKFALVTTNNTNRKYMEISLTPSKEWNTISIALSSLSTPSGSGSTLDLKRVRAMHWRGEAGTGALYIDNVKLRLKSGQIPSDDFFSIYNTPASSIVRFYYNSRHSFQIFQIGKGIAINTGDYLMPQLEIYTLSGKLVLTHNLNMNKGHNGNHLITLPNDSFASGQYIAVLTSQADRSNMMVRRFIWQ